jgi:hypothetical protein
MGLTRRDKKEARSTLKKIQNEKQKQSLLANPPERTYKRQIVHTEMPWPLQVILMGKKDVLIFILIILIIVAVLGIYGAYLLVQYILEII